MALSTKARAVLRVALANRSVAAEIADAVDSGSNAQADAVAEIGTTADLIGVDGTGSNAAPLAETEDRLDTIESTLDAVIAALKAAGIMAT